MPVRENQPIRLTQAELKAHPEWKGFGGQAGQHPPMRGWLATLEQGLARNDRSVIYGVLRDAVPDFGGEAA